MSRQVQDLCGRIALPVLRDRSIRWLAQEMEFVIMAARKRALKKKEVADQTQLRGFGLTASAALTTVGMARWALAWWRHGTCPPLPYVFLSIAALLLVLGVFFPKFLEPLFRVVQHVSHALGLGITYLLLTLAFITLIVPARLWMRFFLKDPLNRSWDNNAVSYWEPCEPRTETRESYFRPY